MGCTSSAPDTRTDEEIVGLCTAPGVKFSEAFQEINGATRNTATWQPIDDEGNTPPIKALVFICHGLLEHSLCYYPIAIPVSVRDGIGEAEHERVSEER
jgi:hypothetical protein